MKKNRTAGVDMDREEHAEKDTAIKLAAEVEAKLMRLLQAHGVRVPIKVNAREEFESLRDNVAIALEAILWFAVCQGTKLKAR